MRRLLVVPAAVALLGMAGLAVKGAFWLGFNSDPDYAYLLNALNLATGEPSGFGGHPGTPVEILGALVLRARHPALSSSELVRAVFARPEPYLHGIALVLLALAAASLFFLGSSVLRVTGDWRLATIAQLGPLVSTAAFHALIKVEPEPFIVAGASLLVALLLRPPSSWNAALSGLVAGALVAAKVTAAPLLVLPALALGGWRARAIAGVACIGSAAALTAPAWGTLHVMADLLVELGTRHGAYGRGGEGFDAADYVRGLLSTAAEPVVWLALAACAAAVVMTRRQPAPLLSPLLTALALAMAGCIAMVARHAVDMRYLVAASTIAAPALALALFVARERAPKPAPNVALWILGTLGVTVTSLVLWQLETRKTHAVAVREYVERTYPRSVRIYSYGASAPAYALHFGNVYAAGRYNRELVESYPRTVYFDPWAQQINAPFDARAALAEPLVVVQGLPLWEDALRAFRGGLAPVYVSEGEAAYVLRSPR